MKVVLDSNVWLAALLFPQGKCAQLHRELSRRAVVIIISDALLAEICGVLESKFGYSVRDAAEAKRSIARQARMVNPTSTLAVIEEDEDDNRVLECAVEGEAQLIVSGDKDLLRLKKYKTIEILSPRELLDLLQLSSRA